MSSALKKTHRWFAPEVIQTSSMDCGPAVLKCLLEGFGIHASYGRLREACQTSVDGTSIDVMEAVVQRLGLYVEQVMLPEDSLWLPSANTLPAMMVTRLSDGTTHFVVVWRRVGKWLQVMDPGVGRKWISVEVFGRQLFPHKIAAQSADWLEWFCSEEAIETTIDRLRGLGATRQESLSLLSKMRKYNSWYAMATFDAAIRMVSCIRNAGGMSNWKEASKLLFFLVSQTLKDDSDSNKFIPERFWSVSGDRTVDANITVNGVVLLRILGKLEPNINKLEEAAKDDTSLQPELEPELASALTEKPFRPINEFWRLIRKEGLVTPLSLLFAIGLAMGAVVLEAVLFRGLFDLADNLNVSSQRLIAYSAFLVFVVVVWLFEYSIVKESLRAGRHLETRVRVLLMSKLPKLNDQYLQSRVVSDMAERSHSVYFLRDLPEIAVTFLRSSWELLFTIIAIGFIAPSSFMLAIAIGIVTCFMIVVAKPIMSERELRVRGHLGSLQKFYFDALHGSVPVRTHSAERSVKRAHEGMLVEWAQAAKRTVSLSVAVEAIRGTLTLFLTALLLFGHIKSVGVTGDLLLLVYWVLKLPALGEQMVSTLLQYPTQRSVAIRLYDVIRSTKKIDSSNEIKTPSPIEKLELNQTQKSRNSNPAVSIEMNNVDIVVAGHPILNNVHLKVDAGEHIAIVGPSGAGKSSLLAMLLGFHEIKADSVFIDKLPLTDNHLIDLRARIAWIDPAVQLWNRSLLDNLRYSQAPGSYADLGSILEEADLIDVVSQFPNGLQASLGESGAKLSGGEGQRVRLARALWQRNIGLALLDEPFRGLDKNKRRTYLDATRKHWRDATLLCVTHDILETKTFDRVLVIEDGFIVEDNSPQTLIKQENSRYRELLNLELKLQRECWSQDNLWRRMTLENGQVRDTGSPVDYKRAQ